MSHRCHLCRGSDVERLIEFGAQPIAHRLLSSADEEEYTHPVTFGFCGECGLTQLVDPVPPEELYTSYNWLSAWKVNPHEPRLLELLEQLPDLGRDASVLEVGSNDGSFLAALRGHGFTRLLGVEPAADAAAAAQQRGIETLHAYFTPELARDLAESRGPFDLFVARQMLEHVADLQGFAHALRTVVRPGAYVLAEVPDFTFHLSASDYSQMWEEHVNTFTSETFARFLAGAGVEVLHEETVVFTGQIFFVVGRFTGSPVATPPPPLDRLRAEAESYRDRWPRFRDAIHRWLAAERQAGKRIAVYGAGCRSSTIVNRAGLAPHLELFVDDQPAKQGKFMPGSRLPILPPEVLPDGVVDLCLLAVNAENEDDVIARHAHFLERGGEFVSIHPPSPRLPAFWPEI